MAETLFPRAAPCPTCGAMAARLRVVRDLAQTSVLWAGSELAHVGAARYECQSRQCQIDSFWQAAPGESLIVGDQITWLKEIG